MLDTLVEETGAVIGAAVEVQRTLGVGLVERAYQRSLAVELLVRGFDAVEEWPTQVLYRGKVVAEQRLDLVAVVNKVRIVVEVKHFRGDESLQRALAILGSYVRVADARVGLLLNFGALPIFVKRVLPHRQS